MVLRPWAPATAWTSMKLAPRGRCAALCGGVYSSSRKMLGVPVGLKVGIDLGVDDKDAARTVPHPGPKRLQVLQTSDRECVGAVPPRDRSEVRVGKLHDVDGIAAAAVEVHLG